MASDLKRKREDDEPDNETEIELDAETAKVLVSRTNLCGYVD